MNRDEIKATIDIYRQALIDNKRVEINVMMVDQNNQRKTRYKGYMLKVSSDDIKPVVVKALEFMEHELTEKTLGVYDLEISVDDVIQTEEKQKVVHGEEILSEISVNYNDTNTVQETTDLSKIKFLVIQLYYQDKSVFLFQKYIQPSGAFRTTEKFVLSGGQSQKERITIRWFVLFYVSDAPRTCDTVAVQSRVPRLLSVAGESVRRTLFPSRYNELPAGSDNRLKSVTGSSPV